MNDTLADLLLGVIEGITEFLPISSTGHLLIAEHWLGARSDLFNIAIQAGAILAVVLIYRARLLELVLGLGQTRNRAYAMKLAVAFGVTAVLGLIVKKLGVELPETLAPIAWALLVGGVVMLGAEALAARRGGDADGAGGDRDNVSWTVAVLVGIAQVVAGVFPGTSRSAAAIFAALLFGRGSRVAATEFAFLVGIPTMFAATAYELLHVLKDGGAAGEDWTGLGIAFVASAITAFIAVKWLLGYIQTHRFTVFAWYRIVLGAALLAWSWGVGGPVAEARAMPSQARADAPSIAPRAAAGARSVSGVAAVEAPSSVAGAVPGPGLDAAERAARDYRALKLCVDAARFRDYAKDPAVRRQWDAFSRGEFPPGISPEMRKIAAEDLDYTFEAMRRAETECADVGERVDDGSIYAVARRAAELGDRNAAFCYLMTSWPMSEARWKQGAEEAAYMAIAPALMDAGIAAGDAGMLMLAGTAAYTDVEGPDAERARRKVARPPDEPWRGNGMVWLMSVWPAGDVDRAATISYLQLAGQDDPRARRSQAAKLAEFVRARMTPAQARQAQARATSLYRTAFHSHFETRERTASERCSY